ncbi:DUF456 domain-containing protein [Nesterenkonia flava]|uniref:DUF456 domain-containing protein n=1 Tax=Nesterenkonia flava TaxID=469799 RepID=A0ABU1FUN4_9MICC|nr:DUF456 domain-containing protein [Nesterenkonia flava]MDR5712364.1 DUF456 domain-containing protein [Nesterenkonia flava]
MLESTTAEAVTTIIIGLVLLAGVVGVILPVLPGSLVIILGLLIWAILVGGPVVWTAAVIGMLLALAGWSASTVLTGRALQRERIPRGPILIGIVCAVIGLVIFPPLGLFLGFALGLFGAELIRRDYDWQAAGSASLKALRAMGIGILVEFLLAGTAVAAFLLAALIHFIF